MNKRDLILIIILCLLFLLNIRIDILQKEIDNLSISTIEEVQNDK